MADKAHNQTDKKLEEMERHLSAIYTRAGIEVEKKAQKYFGDFQRLDDQKRKLLAAGKITKQDYKTWRTNKILYASRFTDLKKQIAANLTHVNEIAMAYTNDQLADIYSLNYNAVGKDVERIGGYSFTLTDPTTVKNLASKDLQLLPYREIDPALDIPWNMKHIQAEVLQGIIQGDSIPMIAARMKNVAGMDHVAAVRNARTMVTGAECRGRQDSYEQAQKDGVILKKEWISTNDGRTRHAHRLLDGQLADVDQPFDSELGDIMYPGDPTARPANVYNCRCTIAAKIIGFAKSAAAQTKEAVEKAVETVEKAKSFLPEFIRNVIGDQQKPFSLENSAEKANKNNYDTIGGHKYRWNCQRCVSAYELRRRGYDVEAMAFDGSYPEWDYIFKHNIRDYNSYVAPSSKHVYFYPYFDTDNPYKMGRGASGAVKSIEAAMTRWGNGSRAVLEIAWSGTTSAHVINVENENGVIKFIDAQCGDVISGHEKLIGYMKQTIANQSALIRIDDKDLILTEKSRIAEAVRKKVQKK